MANITLEGSERDTLPPARPLGPAAADERLEVTLILRPGSPELWRERMARLSRAQETAHLTAEQFAQLHSATDADLRAVADFAATSGLVVVQRHAVRRTVMLSGTVTQVNAAFNVELLRFEYPGGTYRGLFGPLQLPQPLHAIVVAVLGLDTRPQARPHFRQRVGPKPRRSRAATPTASSFTAVQIASLYQFPAGLGEGECVGLIELGGGYRPQDLQAYFGALGLAVPSVTAVSVDHAVNAPIGNPNSADGEVMLDIEVAGAIAPAARIAVYFAPNTDAGFLNAITTAVHDPVNQPSIISISWGGPESSWTGQAMSALDQALQAAAMLGITVCVASGDSGSSDGVPGGADHVDFPASSPYALACGGTRLKATATTILGEVVWHDAFGATGGGVSAFFALPVWQQGLEATTVQGVVQPLTARGVPDVAADADPQTGYEVVVDGVQTVFGGTSAVAPLWAGLIARINALTGRRAGYVQPVLYPRESAFRDITQGNNGAYRASAGWDACTGLGSPVGAQIAAIPGV